MQSRCQAQTCSISLYIITISGVRTGVLGLQVEGARSAWKALLETVALGNDLGGVAMEMLRLGNARFLLDRLHPQTRQLCHLRRHSFACTTSPSKCQTRCSRIRILLVFSPKKHDFLGFF